jgi:beta-glucanase (GH16 family)
MAAFLLPLFSGSYAPAQAGSSTVPSVTVRSCPSGEVLDSAGVCIQLPPGTSTLAFDDEFNGTSVDRSLWTVVYAHGDRSGNEPECYMPANVSESAGTLRELEKVQNVTCPIDSQNGGTGTLSSGYSDGAVQSNYTFTYGIVKARIKYAGGQGPWPDLWLLGTNCQSPTWLQSLTCDWPQSGANEIDIAEILNSDHTNVNQQIHYTSDPSCYPTTTDVSKYWHTYTVAWSPTQVAYRIDGVTTCTLTSPVPTTPMFIIINTAVGGCCGGPIKNNTLPQTTEVDYVRVFH